MNVGVNEQVELLQVTYTALYQNPPSMLLAYSHPHTKILEQWCLTLMYFCDTRFTLVLEHAYFYSVSHFLLFATMSASTWAYMMFGVYNSIQTSPGHCNQLWDAQYFLTQKLPCSTKTVKLKQNVVSVCSHHHMCKIALFKSKQKFKKIIHY